MQFDPQTLSLMVVIALGLAALAILLAAVGARRHVGEPGEPWRLDDGFRGLLEGQTQRIERLEGAARALNTTDKRLQGEIESGIRRIGLLRYDAFEDVGGRLSFSCALLDDQGNGVVMTSINGRQETRVYAKPILAGRSTHNLSLEEEEAIRQALAAPTQAAEAG
jgi:uncharacterized protein DUF4446